jgi:hypothetical protein
MNYVSVTAPDINNGLGCRVTLWVAGCNHNCPGCHNKWTHDYNIGENLGQRGPKYSMVGKNTYGDRAGNGVPGPGQYEGGSQANLTKNPAWKIGTSTRDDDLKRVVREGVPGPGMYEYGANNKRDAPKYKFGTQKRGYVQKSDVPGPGQYHIPCSIVDVNGYTRESGKFDLNYKFI